MLVSGIHVWVAKKSGSSLVFAAVIWVVRQYAIDLKKKKKFQTVIDEHRIFISESRLNEGKYDARVC